MQALIDLLTDRFRAAAQAAFPELEADVIAAAMEVTPSTQPQFGQYQCNAAMRLAKPLRNKPRAIAEALADAVERNGTDGGTVIRDLEVAGPGFINIHLSPEFLGTRVQSLLTEPHLAVDIPSDPQRIVIDFSSPNIAKEMHVGHLRSTIIGDTLARLFEWLGHDVLRLNHVGDWGTQFGMLIRFMKEECPAVLTGEQETDLTHLVGWYKASKKRFDEDETFKQQAQEEVVKLQGGDKASFAAWEKICAISESAYQEIYDLLDIELTIRGESHYNAALPGVVKDLQDRGIANVSDGAVCVFVDGFVNRDGDPLPFMIQKSDGGYGYATTDMAAIRNRVDDEHAQRIVYVTDAGQGQHFAMLFKAAEQAGYVDPAKVRLDHVPFGLVLGPDGKKFKTRSGETEKLIDLLTAAVTHARKLVSERENDMTDEELDALAQTLGIGAVKYADLSCNRVGDYTFSYEKMLRFDGNTAAFMMYSYVRVNGIKRKVGADIDQLLLSGAKVAVEHPSEQDLAVHLLRFPEVLATVADELLPNRLCEYLYQLAQTFNAFFRDCRVEGSDEEASRLLLAEATARTLKEGFQILGLPVAERM